MRQSSCLLMWILLAFVSLIVPSASIAAREQPVMPPVRPRPISPWANWNRHAGLIFSGDVVRVERVSSKQPQNVETVAVTFHVDRAYRGVHAGHILTIREWAGLWVVQPRYRVGEKLLLFLYPPSRLGLTSPVSEIAGRFRVNSSGRVLFSPAQRVLLAGENLEIEPIRDDLPLDEFLQRVRGAEDLR